MQPSGADAERHPLFALQGAPVFHRFLRIVICDPVPSNRNLLALWTEAEADGLNVVCSVDVFEQCPAPAPRYGLLFLSAQQSASCSIPEAGMVCRYGSTAVGLERAGDCVQAPWPLSRRQVRGLIAAAVVRYGEVAKRVGGKTIFMGHPVPVELEGLVPKLQRTVQDLLARCEAAVGGNGNGEGAAHAHTLRGAAMSFGQVVFAELAADLETAFEEGDRVAVAYYCELLRSLAPV